MSGEQIPLAKVRDARREEIWFMEAKRILDIVPETECLRKTAMLPVSTKWVDMNKVSGEEVIVKSRFVARDFKAYKGRDDLFAETLPFGSQTNSIQRRDGGLRKLMFIDVKKADLNPKSDRDVYLRLSEGAGVAPGMCGNLRYWLYGFRQAAVAWEKHYSEKLEVQVSRLGSNAESSFTMPIGIFRWWFTGMISYFEGWTRTSIGSQG